MLDAFSWFASDPLPWDALTTTEADGVFPSATPTAALASALAEISLLEQGHSTVSCHRLIQTATRILHTKGNPHAGLRAAGDLLIAAKPPDMSTVERRHRFAQLLPHGLSVVHHAGEHQIWPEAVHLAFNFVVFLRSEGQLQAAHELALEAALLSEQLPQIEPADELVWKRHIALSYEDIGDEARAIELLQQALDLLIDKLDPLDHVVLVSQVELGRLLAMGTEHERALTLHKFALGGLIETRGTDSDDAMDARRWLAVTERRAGNPHRAVALHEQIEDWYERTGGRGALSRLINRSTMVMALTDASRLNEAVGLGALTVDEATATLGPEHSETLAALDNLARAQLRTGGVDAAVAARTLVLDTRERELPDGHPLLLQARANLATAYTDANRIDDALSIERENVALFETHYGADHPATWTSQNNLASTLVRVGEEVEATRILESVVGRRRDALGEDHPSTLLAEYNYLYSSGAHHQRYRALIQRMADSLGDDAFLTCIARCSYAEMLLDAGDHQTATEEVKIVRELAPNNDLRSRAQSIIDQATQN